MRPTLRFAVIGTAAIAIAMLLDGWAWSHLVKTDIYDHGFGRMLRSMGFLPLWLVTAAALWLETRDRRRALLLAAVPTAGGIADEVLKLVLRRERPGLHDGVYVFRAFGDRPFADVDFGLPSSEAVVAFSAAWLLCRLYPKAWPVWIALAAGCAMARVLAQAHFLSDVTVGAVVAYALVAAIWTKWGPSLV
jgi:membrane-associated phospholipid phosphatase